MPENLLSSYPGPLQGRTPRTQPLPPKLFLPFATPLMPPPGLLIYFENAAGHPLKRPDGGPISRYRAYHRERYELGALLAHTGLLQRCRRRLLIQYEARAVRTYRFFADGDQATASGLSRARSQDNYGAL